MISNIGKKSFLNYLNKGLSLNENGCITIFEEMNRYGYVIDENKKMADSLLSIMVWEGRRRFEIRNIQTPDSIK